MCDVNWNDLGKFSNNDDFYSSEAERLAKTITENDDSVTIGDDSHSISDGNHETDWYFFAGAEYQDVYDHLCDLIEVEHAEIIRNLLDGDVHESHQDLRKHVLSLL